MKIKNILISQPEPTNPEKSPYKVLTDKYNMHLTFNKFFDIVGVTAKEFKKSKIVMSNYTAIIFNSRNAVDHFFRLTKELRMEISDEMKYFCSSETIALYLQNYIQYRKRKIFFGKQHFADLIDIMSKQKDEKYLFPCSDEKVTDYTRYLEKGKFKYTKACMYKSVPKDLTTVGFENFDMIVVFSPIGVKAIVQNFPDFKGEGKIVAAFGASTHNALADAGIRLDIAAPTKSCPSLSMAIENYLQGKEQEPVLVIKPSSLRKTSLKKTGTTKKPKSVFTNKSKYKQILEEKKAANALKRKQRKEERERLANIANMTATAEQANATVE